MLRQFRETQVLRIPAFTLRMGYGEDLYTTLAYYVIGDPFSLPAVFVPEQYLLLFHDLMLMARFFLAGVTFSAYSFYMGKRSRAGVLAGALVYVFNGFTLSGMRHHYFLNPFIFFPLLLIGCERIFRKKKPGLFIFMVFLSAVSNFYFFYMMVLMTVLYAVWRSLRLRGLRQFGGVLLDGLSFLWYGLLGTLLSSFLFLPVVLRFLQDPRTADEKQIPLLWPLKYYQNFVDSFLSNGSSALAESWTYMGFGAVAAFCVLFIFAQRKKHFDQKAAFLGLTALLLTPAAGYVLNGFSYPANRWMWAYALLIGTMTASAVAEISEAGAGTLLKALVLLGAVIAVCVGWHYTFSRETALDVIIALFGAAAVLLGRVAMLEKMQQVSGGEPEQLPGNRNTGGAATAADASADTAGIEAGKAFPAGSPDAPADTAGIEAGRKNIVAGRYALRVQAALLACVMATIAAAGYFTFSPSAGGGVFEYLSRAQIDLLVSRDAAAASSLIDGNLLKAADGAQTPFYRYTTFNPENNTSILYGVSNTQYYWSLSNPDVSQFMKETGQLGSMIHQYDTLDDRTMLNEVAGVRYFLSDSAEGIPFGYEKAEGISYSNEELWPENDSADRYSCEVYENRYALPFGFTSDKWISRESYDALDIPQRQQALMQGIVLEADPGEDYTKLAVAGVQAAGEQAADAQAAGEQTAKGSAQAVFSEQRMPLQIEYDTGKITEADLSADDGTPLRFEASEGGGSVTVCFEGLPDCETALYIRGLQYTPPAGRQGAKKAPVDDGGLLGGGKACLQTDRLYDPEGSLGDRPDRFSGQHALQDGVTGPDPAHSAGAGDIHL